MLAFMDSGFLQGKTVKELQRELDHCNKFSCSEPILKIMLKKIQKFSQISVFFLFDLCSIFLEKGLVKNKLPFSLVRASRIPAKKPWIKIILY